jgi:hypothetical protein
MQQEFSLPCTKKTLQFVVKQHLEDQNLVFHKMANYTDSL